MRRIGTIRTQEEAERFTDYLITLGIQAEEEEGAEGFAIWVHDEDHLEQAKEELDRFLEAPDAARYRDAAAAAELLRKRQAKQDRSVRKKQVDVRQRWDRPIIRQIPATLVLIVLCVLVGFGTDLGRKAEPLMTKLTFVDVKNAPGDRLEYDTTLVEVKRGELWRIFTPILIHFGAIHLFFNMYWLFYLGGLIEARRGSFRYLVFLLSVAAFSNLAQALFEAPVFGGMSGVIYGLFGYVWMKSRFDPSSGFYLMPSTVVILLVWFVLCLTGMVGPIANFAHGGGLLLGVVVGYAPIFLQNLRKN
jgi:GlpG protein